MGRRRAVLSLVLSHAMTLVGHGAAMQATPPPWTYCMTRARTSRAASASAFSSPAEGPARLPTLQVTAGTQQVEDNLFMLFMIGAFRLAMGNMAGWQSPLPFFAVGDSYSGLVDVSRRLFADSQADTAERVVGVLRQFPTQPQLLGGDKLSCEVLGALTPLLFPFLVGTCLLEDWETSSGERWHSKVVIERCRFLETAACKGMCVGLCKQPTERFFNEELGLPLTMEPDFENCSCTMTWGAAPQCGEDGLEDQDLRCFAECQMKSSMIMDRRGQLEGDPLVDDCQLVRESRFGACAAAMPTVRPP